MSRTYHSQDRTAAAIQVLSTRSVSPLKKIKRKAGYGDETDTAETTHATHAMKKLHIDSSTEGGRKGDGVGADTAGTTEYAVGI